MASGVPDSIHFRSQGRSTDDGGTLPGGNPMGSPGASGEDPGEVGVVIENAIEEVPLEGSSQN